MGSRIRRSRPRCSPSAAIPDHDRGRDAGGLLLCPSSTNYREFSGSPTQAFQVTSPAILPDNGLRLCGAQLLPRNADRQDRAAQPQPSPTTNRSRCRVPYRLYADRRHLPTTF